MASIKSYALAAEQRISQLNDVTAIGTTDPVLLAGNVAVQIGGAATSITGKLQRSSRAPADAGAFWSDVDSTPITGNPSTGMVVSGYIEPAAAWYRFNVSAITGTPARVDISGTRVRQ